MPGTIQALDSQGAMQHFQHPEQLKGKAFKKIFITTHDWTSDDIRTYIRPALTALGGELVEW
jgi:hypothetical protein